MPASLLPDLASSFDFCNLLLEGKEAMSLRKAAINLLSRMSVSSSRSVSTPTTSNTSLLLTSLSRKLKSSNQIGSRAYTSRTNDGNLHLLIILSAPFAILGINANSVFAEDVSISPSPGNGLDEDPITGLRKIEDGSVISNEHTAKWRVFTDSGRDYFLQGKLKEAEKLFVSALEEAKNGFGERDPHVASSCNNLAELYRVKKQFDKAEPLYLEAIKILEESYGPEDIRVGVALHNFGQFYLIQKKLGEACTCYERALKIKGRVVGYDNVEYADTMYHLGRVLYLLGKEKDAEALVLDSIRIVEGAGIGESTTCVRRLRYLAQVYLKSNRVADTENVQRKILHIMELSKGWNSLETVFCAEQLGLTLLSAGELKEAEELLERCLNARKTLLPKDHIQIGASMLHIALVEMLKVNLLSKTNSSEALSVLDNAKGHLDYSARVATRVSQKLAKQMSNNPNYGASQEARRDGSAALIILLKSLDAIGVLETTKHEILQSQKGQSPNHEAQNALFRCISAYKEFERHTQISNSRQVKVEYLSCLKHLAQLINEVTSESTNRSKGVTLQELKDEIERIEAKIPHHRN